MGGFRRLDFWNGFESFQVRVLLQSTTILLVLVTFVFLDAAIVAGSAVKCCGGCSGIPAAVVAVVVGSSIISFVHGISHFLSFDLLLLYSAPE